MPDQPNKYFPPTLALLLGAVIWGTIWYPYRVLNAQGLPGIPATFLTYLATLILAAIFFRKSWREFSAAPVLLAALALASGWANVAYVTGTLEGQVMRVLLLFYLAPVWTVPLARWLLNERQSRSNYLIVLVALIGAATMLWRPDAGWPLPRDRADWFGLSAGFAFALNNVLARRLGDCGVGVKTIASCLGVLLITAIAMAVSGNLADLAHARSTASVWLLVGIGTALFGSSLMVFYAVARMPAVRAIVIMLFELVVGAISSHWLAGESLSMREWIGGILIVAATLFSALPARKLH
jgi:drug/metabolite transporter (DMT)-like permease